MALTKKQINALLRINQWEVKSPSGYIVANKERSVIIYSQETFELPQKEADKEIENADKIVNACVSDGDFYLVDYPKVITRSNTGKYKQLAYGKNVILLGAREKPEYRGAFQVSYVNTALEAIGSKAVVYIGKWHKDSAFPVLFILSGITQTALCYGKKAVVAPMRNFDFDKYTKRSKC